MDLINNLLFTAINPVPALPPDSTIFRIPPPAYFEMPTELNGVQFPFDRGGYYSYNISEVEAFSAIEDSNYLENAIQKHWADVVKGRSYVNGTTFYSRFRLDPVSPATLGTLIPPYHMVYAYLVENTRIAQIVERLIQMYQHDEKLTKATNGPENRRAFQWIMNTESLFFKELSNNSYRSISSYVRTSLEATRRNAYWRMFGMDLAFGDLNSNASVNYIKADNNNQSFILLFERFLSEIWQAYTNARNDSGVNTTDMFTITDTAQKIQELLMSRRTTEQSFENYRYFNLSKEEYASVVMMSWLYEAVSYDSPIVKFLRCDANTPGARLTNLGLKVGVNAHTKSEGLLDIAPPMSTLLRRVEFGDYNPENTDKVTRIILSQTPAASPTADEKAALTDLLLIINNWEKATGHKIKNPVANVNGVVKVQPKAVTSMN